MESIDQPIPEFGGAEAVAAFTLGITGLIVFIISIALTIFFLLALQKHYQAIDAQHREFSPPGKVWMLLIPFFNLYWAFIVYPGLGRSYRKALHAKGITDVGDAGEKLGLWVAILIVASCIPLVGIATLIILIMFLVKMGDQKKRLLSAG